MTVQAEIKTKYIPSGPRVMTETLHIRVGKDITLEKGDTIILHTKKAGKIEIVRNPPRVLPDQVPYYSNI